MLDGLTATLRTTQLSSLMLNDVFDTLEDLAALGAAILVCRHGCVSYWFFTDCAGCVPILKPVDRAPQSRVRQLP
jgi:hypothetical protein